MPVRIKNVLPYILLTCLSIGLFSSAGCDDSHITYWAAWSLANLGEIVNYSGNRVEQSSSLLQVAALAAFTKLSGMQIPTSGAIFSLTFALLTLKKLEELCQRFEHDALFPQLFLATSTPFLYWSLGGLEGTLVAFLLVGAVVSTLDTLTGKTTAIMPLTWNALLMMARPEAIFVMTMFYGLLLLHAPLKPEILRSVLTIISGAVLFFLLLLAWRYLYFGDIFPQPVSAKIGFSGSIVEKPNTGLDYLVSSIRQFPSLAIGLISVGYFLAKDRVSKTRSLANFSLAAIVLSYLAFVFFGGTDWMEGARRLVPILPFLSLTIFFAARGESYILMFVILLTLNLSSSLIFAKNHSSGSAFFDVSFRLSDVQGGAYDKQKFSFFELTNRVHYRDVVFVSRSLELLHEMLATDRTYTVLSIQAGMVPFHLFKDHYGKLKFVDAMGLSSRHFTSCSVSRTLKKSNVGVNFSYQHFFQNLDTYATECNIEKPDIIFDLDDEKGSRSLFVETHGYTVIYRQIGSLRGRQPFEGGYVGFNQFLAVRDELYRQASQPPKIIFSNSKIEN